MMGRAYTKYYSGFTLSFLHDSDHCTRCKKLSTFYTKMKNKEPPWDKEDARKVEENCPPSQLKLYGVISYLNAHLKVNSCDANAKSSNHVPVTALKKRHASNHQVNKKSSKFKSSELTERNSETKASKSIARKNISSYQGYRKVVKKAAQRSTGDQTHEKAYKSKILNLKSSPKSPEAEYNVIESNSSPSMIPPVTPDKLDKVSLKRKLRILNKLRRNNNYEDDIFEEKCFYVVKTTQDDESDSSDIKNMATPKCEISLSPRARSESPVYEDCYSPKELGAIRRDAEEFRYRRKKRRRRKLVFPDNGDLGGVKEDLKSEDADHKTLLENVCKAVPLKPEKDSDTDDSYFTDSSEEQS